MRLLSRTPLLAMALLCAAVASAAPVSAAPPNDAAVTTATTPEMIAPAIVVQDTAAVACVVTDANLPALASDVVALPAATIVRGERRRLHGGPSPLGRMTSTPNLLHAVTHESRERPPAS